MRNIYGLTQPVVLATVGVAIFTAVGVVYWRFMTAPQQEMYRDGEVVVRALEAHRPGSEYTFDIDGTVINRKVIIRNRGDEVVYNPRVVVNGERNWFDVETIVNEIIDPGMTARQKAFAIWQFLVDSRIHDKPADTVSTEMHDPVRFLNVYGYGVCDDAAKNYLLLAKRAGIEKGRLWYLTGHVVPEVYYDGDWHMFDPDAEIYFLDHTGTVASVEELASAPGRIPEKDSPHYSENWMEGLADIYGTTENNETAKWGSIEYSGPSMAYILRPGETIVRSWDNRGVYFSTRSPQVEPKRYGNGSYVFKPIFEKGLFRKGRSALKAYVRQRKTVNGFLSRLRAVDLVIWYTTSRAPIRC